MKVGVQVEVQVGAQVGVQVERCKLWVQLCIMLVDIVDIVWNFHRFPKNNPSSVPNPCRKIRNSVKF